MWTRLKKIPKVKAKVGSMIFPRDRLVTHLSAGLKVLRSKKIKMVRLISVLKSSLKEWVSCTIGM